MNNLKVFLLSSAMVLSFGVAALAQESLQPEEPLQPGEELQKFNPSIAVWFKPNITKTQAADLINSFGLSRYEFAGEGNQRIWVGGTVAVEVPQGSEQEYIQKFKASNIVKTADLNIVYGTTEEVNLDEDVQPRDLGVSEPTLLPDSPFYFLKNWGRGIQSFFTFNPVAKSELKNKFASEKLLELKKTIEQKKNQEVIKKAAENYQKGVEEMKKTTEAIKQKAKESPEVDKFLNKFISQQILHQKLLQKLEEQVPSETFEKIKEAREAHLEGFQNVLLKIEDRQDKITEKLNEALEEQKGSEFKDFKNLEVLKNLEEKVPEQAKEAIQRAQENALKRLTEDVGKMSSAKQEEFKGYIEKISGEKEKHLEITESVKAGIKAMPQPTPAVIKLKEKLMETTAEILETMGKKMGIITDCPTWEAPGPAFCGEGRVIVGKDEQGCYSIPRCVVPGEIEGIQPPSITPVGPKTPPSYGGGISACIEIWAPVCGKNEKTYSNECFAKMADAEIAYKGECEGVSTCPEIYCTFDPCPGKHGTDSSGCTNCATPCQGTVVPAVRPEEPVQSKICIQVMTPAISPDGGCKVFPNPCEVPEGWKKVADCPTVIPPTPWPSQQEPIPTKQEPTLKEPLPSGTVTATATMIKLPY